VEHPHRHRLPGHERSPYEGFGARARAGARLVVDRLADHALRDLALVRVAEQHDGDHLLLALGQVRGGRARPRRARLLHAHDGHARRAERALQLLLLLLHLRAGRGAASGRRGQPLRLPGARCSRFSGVLAVCALLPVFACGRA